MLKLNLPTLCFSPESFFANAYASQKFKKIDQNVFLKDKFFNYYSNKQSILLDVIWPELLPSNSEA